MISTYLRVLNSRDSREPGHLYPTRGGNRQARSPPAGKQQHRTSTVSLRASRTSRFGVSFRAPFVSLCLNAALEASRGFASSGKGSLSSIPEEGQSVTWIPYGQLDQRTVHWLARRAGLLCGPCSGPFRRDHFGVLTGIYWEPLGCYLSEAT